MVESKRGPFNGRHARRRFLQTAMVGLTTLSGCLKRTIEQQADRANGTTSSTATPTTQESTTVAVGPDSQFGFYPGTETPLRISTRTTVVFVWKTDSHNIVVDRQPEDASWTGTPDGPETAYETGYTHRHTFTVPGTYQFHCAPHETIGAVGTIEVVPRDTTSV